MRLNSSAPVVQSEPLTSHSFIPFNHSRVSKAKAKPNSWNSTSHRCITSLTKLMVLLLLIDCLMFPPIATSLYCHLTVKLSRCRPFFLCLLCTTQHLMDCDRVVELRNKLWSQETTLFFVFCSGLDLFTTSIYFAFRFHFNIHVNSSTLKLLCIQQQQNRLSSIKKTWCIVLEEIEGWSSSYLSLCQSLKCHHSQSIQAFVSVLTSSEIAFINKKKMNIYKI